MFAENNVSKGTNVREFPYLPENIREWVAVPPYVRRNPVSPLQMLSTGILMARAQAASRGIMLSNRNARFLGGNLSSYGEARMGFNAGLGKGSVM